MSLLRARFDECQSVAGIGAAMGDRCPMSEHAKSQESVDLRHPQCSLKSVESAGRKVRAREVRGEQPADGCFTRRAPRSSSTVLHWVWQSGSCTRTLHCRNNQSAIRALRSAINTAAATGCASKPADQIKRNQVKSSDQKRAGHTQSM